MNNIIKLAIIVALLTSGARMVFAMEFLITIPISPVDVSACPFSVCGGTTGSLTTFLPDTTGATSVLVQSYTNSAYPVGSPVCSATATITDWDSSAVYGVGTRVWISNLFGSTGISCAGGFSGFSDYWVRFSYNGDSYVAQYTVSTGEATAVDADTLTHIVSWVPVTDSTVATGTQSIGFTGHIRDEDFEENMYFSFRNNCIGQFCGLQDSLLDGPVYITSAGIFSYSTTTDLQSTGLHQEEVKIFTPSFNVFGYPLFYTELLSDSSNYNVGTSTTFFNDIYNELANGLASSTAQVSGVCNPISGNFTISLCIVAIIYPSAEQIQSDIQQLRTQAPWGYGFRLYDILNGQATTTEVSLPSLSYTSASTSVFGIATFSFDPFGTLASTTSIVNMAVSDQEEPKNVWDIMEPIIFIIVYLMLGFIIFRDLMKIRA